MREISSYKKARERSKELSADIEEFLKKGGKIEVIEATADRGYRKTVANEFDFDD